MKYRVTIKNIASDIVVEQFGETEWERLDNVMDGDPNVTLTVKACIDELSDLRIGDTITIRKVRTPLMKSKA